MKFTRRIVQFGFLALVLAGVFLAGANVECWCPFGGVEALYTYVKEGSMLCSLGVSNFYILGGVLALTLLARRVFCGYMCPIGTISEWLHAAGGRLGAMRWRVPRRLDRVLSLLKYAVLGTVLWLTWQAGELIFRGFDPCYALISRHGADITCWAYVVAAAIAVASLLVAIPFCRWFCPLAAVLNPFSRFGLTRVERESAVCTDCGRCARACPMAIPVDRLQIVTAARCTSCMDCVAACPKQDAGALRWGLAWPKVRLPQTALLAALLLCTSAAVAATYLFPMASFVKTSRADPPSTIANVSLRISGLTCRGRANLLVWFLERDDLYMIPGPIAGKPGYFKIEAWPAPEAAEVRVGYDPAYCSQRLIKQAITEPYYNAVEDRWWMPPFAIEGYDPLRQNGTGPILAR